MAIRMLTVAAVMAGASLLAACDKSPQNADGATAQGDAGTAAVAQGGGLADTGQDNGAAQVGASGEVGTGQTIGGATSPDGDAAANMNAQGAATTAPAPK